MQVKYTKAFLSKLEDIFAESDYALRYEKGSFKSGYCVVRETKIVLVNNFYPLEGKVNCLLDILRNIDLDTTAFNDKNKRLLAEIRAENEVSGQISLLL
jgi:hypothetical protein